VAGSMSVAVARSIAIEAGDQILLKVGSASMLMRKDGSITLIGKAIDIKGSGDVVIKGSKVLTN
jgi:type VI secretion system secreted protein VgrG